MIIQKHKLFTEIIGCKALGELYSEKEKLDGISVLLLHGDDMEEAPDDAVASWLSAVDFITVFAAENISRFSYEFLSEFDVRLGGAEYPASSARADDRYRLLCGDTAYEVLSSGTSDTAPNFVTVLSGEESFDAKALAYVNRVCGDKTEAQMKILTRCLKAAVNDSIKAVLTAESEGFYALMAQKTEDAADE